MLSDAATPPRAPDSLFDRLEAERPALLAAVAARLDGWAIPGGDIAAWLAGVPILLIADCLHGPRAAMARRLFLLVGDVRGGGLRGDLFTADHTNLITGATGTTAALALETWSACALARCYLDAGRPADAVPVLATAAMAMLLEPKATAMRGLAARVAQLQAEAADSLTPAGARGVA